MTEIIHKTDSEKINFIWKTSITEEELDEIKKEHPNLMFSYYLQEKLFKNK